MSQDQTTAKYICDLLVANGIVPPPGVPKKDWKPRPVSYEGSFLIVLNALRNAVCSDAPSAEES